VLGFALGRKAKPAGKLKLALAPTPSAYGLGVQPLFWMQLKPANVVTAAVSTAMARMALLLESAMYSVLTPSKARPSGLLNAAARPTPST
jgi:hypothetical protein